MEIFGKAERRPAAATATASVVSSKPNDGRIRAASEATASPLFSNIATWPSMPEEFWRSSFPFAWSLVLPKKCVVGNDRCDSGDLKIWSLHENISNWKCRSMMQQLQTVNTRTTDSTILISVGVKMLQQAELFYLHCWILRCFVGHQVCRTNGNLIELSQIKCALFLQLIANSALNTYSVACLLRCTAGTAVRVEK